jgi:hypothetical protein
MERDGMKSDGDSPKTKHARDVGPAAGRGNIKLLPGGRFVAVPPGQRHPKLAVSCGVGSGWCHLTAICKAAAMQPYCLANQTQGKRMMMLFRHCLGCFDGVSQILEQMSVL